MVWQAGMDLSRLEGSKTLAVELNARSRIGVKLRIGLRIGLRIRPAKDLGAAGTRSYSIDTGRPQAELLLGGEFSGLFGQCRGFDGS